MPDCSLSLLPGTRKESLDRLEEFLPHAARYTGRRNHVEIGHNNVSRLSTATRTRLVLESELCEAARAHHDACRIEKFEQEVWWRLYWKGWLELRPSVWDSYRDDLGQLEWTERAEAVAKGDSGMAILDHFARELLETGYLHNHARMWWASYWIHGEGLPWQLGAEWFLRHLLDGDPASNTLSWRWVAGLQTKGKSYLVRRDNIEHFVDPELLATHPEGLDRLASIEAVPIEFREPPAPRSLDGEPFPEPEEPWGLWIHDEDLCIESSPLTGWRPSSILATAPLETWDRLHYPVRKREFLLRALRDGVRRAEEHFRRPSGFSGTSVVSDALLEWAGESGLRTIVTIRPFVGPLADLLPAIENRLEAEGVRLQMMRRPDDIEVMNRATGGFFGFWKKTAALRDRV